MGGGRCPLVPKGASGDVTKTHGTKPNTIHLVAHFSDFGGDGLPSGGIQERNPRRGEEAEDPVGQRGSGAAQLCPMLEPQRRGGNWGMMGDGRVVADVSCCLQRRGAQRTTAPLCHKHQLVAMALEGGTIDGNETGVVGAPQHGLLIKIRAACQGADHRPFVNEWCCERAQEAHATTRPGSPSLPAEPPPDHSGSLARQSRHRRPSLLTHGFTEDVRNGPLQNAVSSQGPFQRPGLQLVEGFSMSRGAMYTTRSASET